VTVVTPRCHGVLLSYVRVKWFPLHVRPISRRFSDDSATTRPV
jgi:hypothetical protein